MLASGRLATYRPSSVNELKRYRIARQNLNCLRLSRCTDSAASEQVGVTISNEQIKTIFDRFEATDFHEPLQKLRDLRRNQSCSESDLRILSESHEKDPKRRQSADCSHVELVATEKPAENTETEAPAAKDSKKSALKYKRSVSVPLRKKGVFFADTVGEPLERVRLISESREDPPKFLVSRKSSNLSRCRSSKSSNFDYIFGGSAVGNESGGGDNDPTVHSLMRLMAALKTGQPKGSKLSTAMSYPVDLSKLVQANSGGAPVAHAANGRRFVPSFSQPALNTSLLTNRLVQKQVSLERATFFGGKLRGTVLCKNIDFQKSVACKWTVDGWKSDYECSAVWRRTNLDGSHDVFEFAVDVPVDEAVKSVEFCLKYKTSSGEYWDSNEGRNYVFQQFKS